MAPAYATPAELAEFLAPDPAPADPVAGRLLVRASRDVRRATQCAVYDVNEEGMPTASAVLAAMKEATLEQAAYRIDQGDDEGIPSGGVSSATIVSVSVTAGGAGSGGTRATTGGLAAQAWQALTDAGLTGHAPDTGGC